jgi:hypothetical protein
MKHTLTKAALVRCSALLGLALVTTACRAERHLIFESDPPGAQVFLDGKSVGHTPVKVRFESYGYRHVTVEQRGYRSYTTVMEVPIPWYSRFPMDYITEVLLPFGWEDIHHLDVTLEPRSGEVSRPDFDGVLRRAASLRRGGPAGPTEAPAAKTENDNS